MAGRRVGTPWILNEARSDRFNEQPQYHISRFWRDQMRAWGQDRPVHSAADSQRQTAPIVFRSGADYGHGQRFSLSLWVRSGFSRVDASHENSLVARIHERQAIFRQYNHGRERFDYWVRIKRLVTVTFRAQPERNIGMEVA